MAARLVLVLDPGGKLNLSDEDISSQITSLAQFWKVLRYDGNDLAFRRQFDSSVATLVWVTGSKLKNSPIQINLNSIVDIARRADETLDFSLLGCLKTLLPNESWPAGPVAAFQNEIGAHLGFFLQAYKNLKPHLDPGAALSLYSIQALILACIQPTIQPHEFLFKVDSPVALLKKYIAMAWTHEWNEVDFHILQDQAREASSLSLEGLASWFDVDIHGLAQLIYFYRILSSARIPNTINQIRGLGLLNFDPESLEAGLGQVMILWEKDTSWRIRLIQNAESDLEIETIQRASGLLSSSSSELAKNLASAESPAMTYALSEQLIVNGVKEGKIIDLLETWSKNRPALLDQVGDNPSGYALPLKALGSILDEAAYIQNRTTQEIVSAPTLDKLMDWYVKGRYYDLEYAYARALMSLAVIKEDNLRDHIQTILDKLRKQLRNYLDKADHILAKQIQENWYAYSTSPELSPNILKDFVERARYTPTDAACLWVIIFDGMRFDTWESVVKPCLQKVFEIKKEKTYLSPLPSWTSIARTSITAGRTPDLWKGYRDSFTYNQALLAGKFFHLPENQYMQKLQFYSGMESDRTISKIDRNRRYLYNILIFNISDDDLHKQRGHIGTLNENIKSAMDQILLFLDGLIKKDDTVIVTSDHGFMELDPGDAIVVKDNNKWQRYMEGGEHPVHFRFIRSENPLENIESEDVMEFEWKIPNGKFAVAIGKHWFQRDGSRNSVRFDHGGLSFAEMVVPGVLMQPIREKKIDLNFEGLPGDISVNEGQSIILIVTIANRGNQMGAFNLLYSLNTDGSPRIISDQISPNGKYEAEITLIPVSFGDGKKTDKLTLMLNYKTITDQIQTRRQDIPVQIIERKDVVKISLGGLDDLDL